MNHENQTVSYFARIHFDWVFVEQLLNYTHSQTHTRKIRTQGIGDIYRIYLSCQKDGLDFYLAYIPETFDMKPKEDFDKVYMGKLFDLGYQLGKNGHPWEKAPPGFE